jgi:hypothetical protein
MIVTKEQVAAIHKHANEHYGTDGWDMVRECQELREMQEIADRKGCTDYATLFAAVAADAKLWAEVNEDINGY